MLGILVWAATASIVEDHETFGKSSVDLTRGAVVAIFERVSGRQFQVEHVPEPTLLSQFEGATDPMQKSFAALMLGCLRGDAMDMAAVVARFGIELTSVDDYARGVVATEPTT
jgi:hypothetical protein